MFTSSISLRTFAVAATLTLCTNAFAQDSITSKSSEREIREQVLSKIDEKRSLKSDSLEKKIQELTEKITSVGDIEAKTLDQSLKLKAMTTRVQLIEARQAAIGETELNTYKINYQSAVTNLISMERDLNPLVLFDAARKFYGGITEASNPMNYDGYKVWYDGYTKFIEEETTRKDGANAKARMIQSALKVANDLTKGSPLTGTFTNVLFSGVDMLLQAKNTKSPGLEALKVQSEKMMTLSLVLSQFTEDKDLIETEWESINTELDSLQKQYNTVLRTNLNMLGVSHEDFTRRFTKESDARKWLSYMNELNGLAEKAVATKRAENSKEWKDEFYVQMQEVQSLKMRFGQVTFRISQNTASYNGLIEKYRGDASIGKKVGALSGSLQALQSAFEKSFSPLSYIKSASQMYKVE